MRIEPLLPFLSGARPPSPPALPPVGPSRFPLLVLEAFVCLGNGGVDGGLKLLCDSAHSVFVNGDEI